MSKIAANKTAASPTTTEDVYKIREVAERLKIDQNLAYRLVQGGSLRSILVGRAIRIPESALVEFVSNGGSRPKKS